MANPVKLQATYFNQREYQLQGKNHFEVQFGVNKNGADDGKGLWTDDLTLLVKSFPLPSESTEVVPIDHFNQQIKLAGKTTFDGGSLVIHDAITPDKDVELMFRQWRNMVYNASQGTVGYAADYKTDGIVTEYSPNGETYRQWYLVGCWPNQVNYGELDYETGGYKDITATITYDWAYRLDKDDAANA